MIFPARAGGMSSLASLVPPSFGVQGPCAMHHWHWGWPGRAVGSVACLGSAGLCPTEPWEKHELSLGTGGKGGRGRWGSQVLGPCGESWLSPVGDTTFSHWGHSGGSCSTVVMPTVPCQVPCRGMAPIGGGICPH